MSKPKRAVKKKKLKRYDVKLVKQMHVRGIMRMEAESPQAAIDAVYALKESEVNPLQTNDPRIDWDDPEYIDWTFEIDDSDDPEEA